MRQTAGIQGTLFHSDRFKNDVFIWAKNKSPLQIGGGFLFGLKRRYDYSLTNRFTV